MVEAGVRSLAARFPDTRAAMAPRALQYNKIFTDRWNNIIDFIKLHYCLTQRNDTEFWRDQVRPETIPKSLQEKLTAWKHYGVSDSDFPNKYDIFGIASWQYIIYGLDYIPAYVECGTLPKNISDKAIASIETMAINAKEKIETNRELIQKYILP